MKRRARSALSLAAVAATTAATLYAASSLEAQLTPEASAADQPAPKRFPSDAKRIADAVLARLAPPPAVSPAPPSTRRVKHQAVATVQPAPSAPAPVIAATIQAHVSTVAVGPKVPVAVCIP